MDKVSYALGLGIGQQLKSMGAQDLCIDDFAQAIKDVLENKELAVSHHEAQSIVTQYFQEKEAAMNKEKEAKGKQAKADGEKFLKENAQKEGVVTTASGLQYMAKARKRQTRCVAIMKGCSSTERFLTAACNAANRPIFRSTE